MFPSHDALWSGAILGTISHALSLTQCPDFAHEQSWDGKNYSVQDSQGARGTVSFGPAKMVVAALQDYRSARSPYRSEKLRQGYAWERLFVGAPARTRRFAERNALEYVLDDLGDRVMPVITAAFWGQGEDVRAVEAWRTVTKHGGHLLRRQVLPVEPALRAWAEDLELTKDDTRFVRAAFEARMSKKGKVHLARADARFLRSRSVDVSAFKEARQTLAEIGVEVAAAR